MQKSLEVVSVRSGRQSCVPIHHLPLTILISLRVVPQSSPFQNTPVGLDWLQRASVFWLLHLFDSLVETFFCLVRHGLATIVGFRCVSRSRVVRFRGTVCGCVFLCHISLHLGLVLRQQPAGVEVDECKKQLLHHIGQMVHRHRMLGILAPLTAADLRTNRCAMNGSRKSVFTLTGLRA